MILISKKYKNRIIQKEDELKALKKELEALI